ncbi:energy-coupling factor transporter transmembrane component T [Paenibacillus campi]|uniref:energy-coupling factor transporter transmembrane component T family protein n=1 Tax=Paenibacillus campi TaxID=3106031 RepID=UPI002AFE04C9|nr:energy-coupling factor transporter transmembrane component T [Paenibacillus sp. SGZ-1009]
MDSQKHRWLYRIDPLTKIVLLLYVSVLAVHIGHALPQFVLFAVVWLAIWWGSGQLIGRPLFKLLLVIGIPYFVLSLLSVRSGVVLWQTGALQMTSGGLDYGAVMTLRIFILCMTSAALSLTTDYQELVSALVQQLKVPYRFAYGLALALTFLPLLREEAKLALAARTLRGQRRGRGLEAMRQQREYFDSVFTGAVRRIQHIAGAMDAKGFGAYPERTFYRPFVLPAAALPTMLIGLLLTIMACIIL